MRFLPTLFLRMLSCNWTVPKTIPKKRNSKNNTISFDLPLIMLVKYINNSSTNADINTKILNVKIYDAIIPTTKGAEINKKGLCIKSPSYLFL